MVALKTFRQSVQDELDDAFPFPFIAGPWEGPSPDRDFGCVWSRGKREADPVTDEEVFLGVRVFKQWKQVEESNDVPNADELEDFADLVQTTMAQVLTTMGVWFLRVTELEILWEQSGVEATIVGRQLNAGGY